METALEVCSHLPSDHNVKSPPLSVHPPLSVFKRALPPIKSMRGKESDFSSSGARLA